MRKRTETPMAHEMREELITRVKTNRGYLTADGRERPDPTPMAPPVGYRPPDPLHLKLRQMIISEKLAREAAEQGMETFEEADDFDVGDDYDPSSPYEEQFDPAGFEPGAATRFVQEVQSRNAPRGSAEEQDLPDPIDQAPPRQQPTGAGAEGGGTQGVHPGTPPESPPPKRPPGRSFFSRISE